MALYKLTYFDAAASRGEECRLALHVAGLSFEDERLNRDQWTVRKASTPFGALPVLTVDGRQLAQSNAILRFIGSQHGLHPAEPFIDYIPTDVFGAFPKLLRLVEAVKQHSRVVDWYARK